MVAKLINSQVNMLLVVGLNGFHLQLKYNGHSNSD